MAVIRSQKGHPQDNRAGFFAIQWWFARSLMARPIKERNNEIHNQWVDGHHVDGVFVDGHGRKHT